MPYTDVDFLIKGKTVPAHKIFLASSSQYFHGMFLSGLAETISNIVELKDIEYNVFLAVQEYLYTGDVQEITGEIAVDLLACANLYNFPRLKAIVENILGFSIELENVCFLLDIANLYTCNSLYASCMVFIIQNYTAAKCTDSYNNLTEELKTQIRLEYAKSIKIKTR